MSRCRDWLAGAVPDSAGGAAREPVFPASSQEMPWKLSVDCTVGIEALMEGFTSGGCLLLLIKFYWNTASPTCLVSRMAAFWLRWQS